MSVTSTTHLNFRGSARAALGFYQSVFGGHAVVVTDKDAGDVQNESEADWVKFGQVIADNGFRVMAYDVPSAMPYEPGTSPFFVSVQSEDADEISTLWQRLAKGSNVVHPLGPAAWSPLYGMLTDRFGVTWILDVPVPYNG
ncbi:VOC family protein [Streptomyces anulatus]|uniref:VOC family protein n=1 Tax=Streptomyces anulatus TaxID=1892 RepID=UPI0033F12753